MSERADFDEIFDGLRGVSPPAPFAGAAAVRRRGRQRARRQAAVAAVAVLALAGVGSGGVMVALDSAEHPPVAAAPERTGEAGGFDAPGSPGADAPDVSSPGAASPDAAALGLEISDAWPLTAADLGQGWQPTGHELFESDPPWHWAELCPRYRAEDYPSLPRRTSFAAVSFHNQSLPGRVDQILERFQPGAADENLRDVRVAATICSARPDPTDEVAPTSYDPIRTGFAGDESVLFLEEAYYFDREGEIALTTNQRYVAVVQVGDVVSTTLVAGAVNMEQALEIAATAAARLP